jgi:hypothetical protein
MPETFQSFGPAVAQYRVRRIRCTFLSLVSGKHQYRQCTGSKQKTIGTIDLTRSVWVAPTGILRGRSTSRLSSNLLTGLASNDRIVRQPNATHFCRCICNTRRNGFGRITRIARTTLTRQRIQTDKGDFLSMLRIHCTMRWGLGGPPCVHRCAYLPSPMCCKKHIFI